MTENDGQKPFSILCAISQLLFGLCMEAWDWRDWTLFHTRLATGLPYTAIITNIFWLLVIQLPGYRLWPLYEEWTPPSVVNVKCQLILCLP